MHVPWRKFSMSEIFLLVLKVENGVFEKEPGFGRFSSFYFVFFGSQNRNKKNTKKNKKKNQVTTIDWFMH